MLRVGHRILSPQQRLGLPAPIPEVPVCASIRLPITDSGRLPSVGSPTWPTVGRIRCPPTVAGRQFELRLLTPASGRQPSDVVDSANKCKTPACCVPLAACDWLTTIRSRWMDRSIVSCCQCAAMVLRYFHGLFEAEIGQSQYRSSDSKGCLRCLGSSRRRCRGLVFLEVVRISVRPFHFQTPAHLLGFQPRQDSPRSPPRTGRGISRI
jgi:hypothetical protein